jgi:hypothetical protein
MGALQSYSCYLHLRIRTIEQKARPCDASRGTVVRHAFDPCRQIRNIKITDLILPVTAPAKNHQNIAGRKLSNV